MTIGIMGCDSGMGATHLAIALCSYCASKQKKKAAYLELHARSEIAQLVSESDLVSAKGHHSFEPGQKYFCFRLHGIDFYPHVSGSEIPALLNQGYDCLILDMGSLKEADISEFLRCDHKVVLGSLAPWKIWEYEDFFHQFKKTVNLGEGFYYLVQTGTVKSISRFSKAHHISMLAVPFIKNPFRIEKELFLFLEELLPKS